MNRPYGIRHQFRDRQRFDPVRFLRRFGKRNGIRKNHFLQVGFFNPVARGKEVKLRLELDRIDHWVNKGAQQSDRVRQLVSSYRKQVAVAA